VALENPPEALVGDPSVGVTYGSRGGSRTAPACNPAGVGPGRAVGVRLAVPGRIRGRLANSARKTASSCVCSRRENRVRQAVLLRRHGSRRSARTYGAGRARGPGV